MLTTRTAKLEIDDKEYTVVYTYAPGTSGVYSGPPERCYEDEPPELEIYGAWCDNTAVQDEEVLKMITAHLLEVEAERGPDYDEEDLHK